jgi:hypothetical protein
MRQQALQLLLVTVKGKLGCHAFGFVGGQHVVPDIHPQVSEAARNVSESGKARDLPLGDKPGPVFDSGHFHPVKNTQRDKRQQRHNHKNKQSPGDGHNFLLAGSTRELPQPKTVWTIWLVPIIRIAKTKPKQAILNLKWLK